MKLPPLNQSISYNVSGSPSLETEQSHGTLLKTGIPAGRTELLSESHGTFWTPFIEQADTQLRSWCLAQLLTRVGSKPSLALLLFITIIQLNKATDTLQYIKKVRKYFDIGHGIIKGIIHFYSHILEFISNNLVDKLL